MPASNPVFLHGDLSCVNLVLDEDNGVTALLDFSDNALGPTDHEFISPVTHQFRGEARVLRAFWEGAGVEPGDSGLQHRILVRSLHPYADVMGRYLERLPPSAPTSWEEAARRFFRISG